MATHRDAPSADPLSVQNVTKHFGGVVALADVSIVVPEAGIVGLIGPNGAGKTTLFNCVTGVFRPTSGAVFLFGSDVTNWPPHRRARLGVSRTYQRLELFKTLTIRENILAAFEARFGRANLATDIFVTPATIETRDEAEDQTDVVLEVTGLADSANVMAGEVPLGVARVIEFARALVTRPKLMMLDEPNSGLRAEESERIGLLIRAARDQGTSVLIVEHDMSFVLGLSDYCYVLDFGRQLAEGTPAEVRSNPIVQAAYLGTEGTADDAAMAELVTAEVGS